MQRICLALALLAIRVVYTGGRVSNTSAHICIHLAKGPTEEGGLLPKTR
jgi:hypothetical protein